MPTDPVLILLEWDDACHGIDERHQDDVGELARLTEIGILRKETPQSLTLSMEFDPADNVYIRNWITVPKKNIRWSIRIPFSSFHAWLQANGAMHAPKTRSKPSSSKDPKDSKDQSHARPRNVRRNNNPPPPPPAGSAQDPAPDRGLPPT